MPSLGDFFYTQFVLKIPKPSTCFAAKTVIITGASSGLGKAAKHIVRLSARKVNLGCRSISKGENTKREIESVLQCGGDILEVWQVDIEPPSSVKESVERANQLPRLDVLINNAGIQTINFQLAYGTERTVGVNVIGTFLLAIQLIPKLKETARLYKVTPHMTFVEPRGDIFAWFQDKSHVQMMTQYAFI